MAKLLGRGRVSSSIAQRLERLERERLEKELLGLGAKARGAKAPVHNIITTANEFLREAEDTPRIVSSTRRFSSFLKSLDENVRTPIQMAYALTVSSTVLQQSRIISYIGIIDSNNLRSLNRRASRGNGHTDVHVPRVSLDDLNGMFFFDGRSLGEAGKPFLVYMVESRGLGHTVPLLKHMQDKLLADMTHHPPARGNFRFVSPAPDTPSDWWEARVHRVRFTPGDVEVVDFPVWLQGYLEDLPHEIETYR